MKINNLILLITLFSSINSFSQKDNSIYLCDSITLKISYNYDFDIKIENFIFNPRNSDSLLITSLSEAIADIKTNGCQMCTNSSFIKLTLYNKEVNEVFRLYDCQLNSKVSILTRNILSILGLNEY